MDILTMANTENEITLKNAQKYRNFYEHTNEAIAYTLKFIDDFDPSLEAFHLFLREFQNGLSLAFLSTLRLHDTQSQLMLRIVLESIVLCAYSMKEKSFDTYSTRNDDGTISEEIVKTPAHTWLKENYNEFNDKIHFMKKAINHHKAHTNLIMAISNYDLDHTNVFLMMKMI